MSVDHFTNYHSTREAIVGFSKVCRENGLNIGLGQTKEAVRAGALGFVVDENSLRYSLKSLFCTKTEEFETFNKCFDVYWLTRRHEYSHTFKKGSSNIAKKNKASLALMGFNPNKSEKEEEKEEAKNVTGASRVEILKATDFSKLSEIDSEFLDRIASQLLRQLNHRLRRQLRVSKKGKLDIRKTIRRNSGSGDILLRLVRQNKKLEKYRLVLLLDVSGSMDKYSFYLLKFLWSLKSNLKQIETFIFSTRLLRITEMLEYEQLEQSMFELGYHANNWSGGTQIGECLRDFNEEHSRRVLNGRSVTIILSDGLDTGSSELLNSELEKIKLRTSKLVWLNPLKGASGYEPLAKGMSTALPWLDEFRTAHNLNSLVALENVLADV